MRVSTLREHERNVHGMNCSKKRKLNDTPVKKENSNQLPNISEFVAMSIPK